MKTSAGLPFRFGTRAALLSVLTVAVTWLYAHEGHVALPSRGAQVDAAKGTIIPSRDSRDALDVRSAEISLQPLPESVLAYATIAAPWQRHAFASSRLAGRIVALHVRPGQTVAAGQVLAEVASPELENLQLEILSAQTDLLLAEQIVATLRESRGSVAEQVILEAENKRSQARNALEIGRALPAGVVVERQVFRQAEFIRTAVDDVVEAIRDGSIWVVLVLFVFLANFRTSLITLTAIPLSVLSTFLIFRWLGVTINTMTLGGIAVAVGELVDDAIVDIENIYRRLKENRQKAQPEPSLKVIFRASAEVRNSIVYATLIVCLVVMPLFAMAGLEGRMFAPLGLAYLLSLLASLAVSLTVTPALASFLLPHARFMERKGDPLVLRGLKWLVGKLVRWSLRHPGPIVGTVAVVAIGSKLIVFWMGSEFLPPFNEGTLTINVQLEPGTSLRESTRVAERVETILLRVPEVVGIARRTGRAEQDEHAEGVNSSELDVRLTPHERPKPGFVSAFLRGLPGLQTYGVEITGRPNDVVLADIRDKITTLPNVKVNIGQPISHRLDHVMSGVRAQIAVKVFGNDLRELRTAAQDIQAHMSTVAGIVDLQIEPQVEIPQLRLKVKRQEAARYGLAPGDVARLLETAYKGRAVSQVLDDDRYFQLVVWYDEKARNDPGVIGQTILDSPSGRKVALSQVAEVLDTTGPNTFNHEHVERRIVVSCNVQGRDLGSVIADIQQALRPVEVKLRSLPGSYHVEYGGQFEAQQQAGARLTVLALLSLVGVFLLLWSCLESWRAALMVMLVNIPLAAVGSVTALLLINRPHGEALQAAAWWQWPRIWAGATTLSLAHRVGFITLIGIVSRNGIMMISHYIHLMKHEGEQFTEEMIVRGTLERLAPVLMTALTAILGLIPLALGAGQPGKEILYPLAIVVIGGLLDAAILDQIVTPAVFWKFGRKVYRPTAPTSVLDAAWDDEWSHEPPPDGRLSSNGNVRSPRPDALAVEKEIRK